jgi:hypothetical protein
MRHSHSTGFPQGKLQGAVAHVRNFLVLMILNPGVAAQTHGAVFMGAEQRQDAALCGPEDHMLAANLVNYRIMKKFLIGGRFRNYRFTFCIL